MRASQLKHPFIELLSKYQAVFQAAWAARKQLEGPYRTADEAAFLPAALSLQSTPVHPAPRKLAYIIISIFILALLWSFFGWVDIVAVASGRIIVNERTKLIQPLQNSIVQKIMVKDGDRVEAGQLLVALDPTFVVADQKSADEQLKASQSELFRARRLIAALEGKLPKSAEFTGLELSALSPSELVEAQIQFQAEWSDIQAKEAKLLAEVKRRRAEIETARAIVQKTEATLPLSIKREEDFKKLIDQGFMAPHAGQDRARERIELERDLATYRARLSEAMAALDESQNTRTSYLAETRRVLHERQSRATLTSVQAIQEQKKASQRERQTTLVSPVAGTVQQLAANTVGGVVTEAQVLMVIVPDAGAVVAEVMLDNKDVGFVMPGQHAEIKLETFSFTRYGTIPAEVTFVAQDAVQDEKRGAIFPVRMALLKDSIDVDGRLIRVGAGMNVTGEIKTGKRRVIDYLLSPVKRMGSESLRER